MMSEWALAPQAGRTQPPEKSRGMSLGVIRKCMAGGEDTSGGRRLSEEIAALHKKCRADFALVKQIEESVR